MTVPPCRKQSANCVVQNVSSDPGKHSEGSKMNIPWHQVTTMYNNFGKLRRAADNSDERDASIFVTIFT